MSAVKGNWWKTVLKGVLFLTIAFITVMALLLSWISFEGRRELARVKADLLARGEKLSLAELVPPPIPDEQNFFADPMWEELADVVERESSVGPYKLPRLEKGKRLLDGLNRPLTDEERKSLEEKFPKFAPIDSKKGNLNIAREAWKASPEEGTAEFVLATLAFSQPVISRIQHLAQRPEARFPLSYENAFMTGMEHFSYLLSAAQWFHQRGLVSLKMGYNESAGKDALTIFRLADTLSSEPYLISFLVRVSIDSLGLDIINKGIKAHVWTDVELRAFEHVLAAQDVPAWFAVALRGERGAFNQFCESLREGDAQVIQSWLKASEQTSGLMAKIFPTYMWSFGGGSQALHNRMMQEWIDAADTAWQAGLNSRRFPTEEMDAILENPWQRSRHLFVTLAFPSIISSAERAIVIQNQITQTRLACALECYRLEHGEYPESLDALVPEFLETLPVDVITLQPMHYQKSSPDSFRLWSVGLDESDEDGQPGKKRSEGDWVWGEVVR